MDTDWLSVADLVERIGLGEFRGVNHAARQLLESVDFYSGLIYQAMGFPVSMFTVLFANPRISGWLAHWQELLNDPAQKISRAPVSGTRDQTNVPTVQ